MAETLFDYGAGQSTDTFTDLTFPDQPATPQTLPAGALSQATTPCAQFGLAAGAATDACLVDVGITGDADFATEGATAQSVSLGMPSNAGSTTIGSADDGHDRRAGRDGGAHVPGDCGAEAHADGDRQQHRGRRTHGARSERQHRRELLCHPRRPGSATSFTLPTTGTYTISVDPRDQLVGIADLRRSATCPTTPGRPRSAPPTTVTIGTIGEVAVRTFTGDRRPEADADRDRQHVSRVRIVTVARSERQHRRDAVRFGGDRVPRRVHAARDRHLHDHRRSTRRATGSLTFLLSAGAGQHRARRRSARRRR